MLLERAPRPTVASGPARASKTIAGRHMLGTPRRDAAVLGRDGDLWVDRDAGRRTRVLRSAMATCRCRRTSRGRTDAADRERYQTVYAREPGRRRRADRRPALRRAAARARSPARGVARAAVTLHVGAGTFQPRARRGRRRHVACTRSVHDVPAEAAARSPQRARRGGRVVAVGTTVVRALETRRRRRRAARRSAAETRLFIRPGYRFRVVDAPAHQFPPARARRC